MVSSKCGGRRKAAAGSTVTLRAVLENSCGLVALAVRSSIIHHAVWVLWEPSAVTYYVS